MGFNAAALTVRIHGKISTRAVILWDTTHPQRVVYHLRDQSDFAHLSPLGGEHIDLPATTNGKHRLLFVQIMAAPLAGTS